MVAGACGAFRRVAAGLPPASACQAHARAQHGDAWLVTMVRVVTGGLVTRRRPADEDTLCFYLTWAFPLWDV